MLKDLLHFSEVLTLGNVPAISKDPADNLIIATALAGDVDYLVTWDMHDNLLYSETAPFTAILISIILSPCIATRFTLSNFQSFFYVELRLVLNSI